MQNAVSPLPPPADLHIHTPLSRCCRDDRQTPGNVIGELAELGVRRIAFTDHVWLNPAAEPGNFYRTQRSDHAIRMLKTAMHTGDWPLEVLVGCEADMTSPETIGITSEACLAFDVVLLASDHFHLDGVEKPAETTPAGVARHMKRFFLAAARSGVADILAHPLIPIGYMEAGDRILDWYSDAELFDMLAVAAQAGVAIEINGGVLAEWRQRALRRESLVRVFAVAKAAGCTFTCGSDAHDFDAYRERYRLVAECFCEAGLADSDWSPWMTAPLRAE